MKKIDKRVKEAVLNFVSKGQSFTSLDIYCVLGVRINDDEYPIYEQVWDIFRSREIPSYLSEYATITLECGGYAKLWRYYKPTVDVKEFLANKCKDGRVEIPKEALGHFPLLDNKLACTFHDGKVELREAPAKYDGDVIDASNRVKLSLGKLKQAKLEEYKSLRVKVYLNRIEIIGDKGA